MQLEQTRSASCASDFLLDRALAHELTTEEQSELDQHVASCARCNQRLAVLQGFRQEATDPSLPTSLQQRRDWLKRSRTPLAIAASFAVAAAVLLTFRPGASIKVEDGTRAKGHAPHIGFYLKRGAAIWQAKSGEKVEAGDAVQIVYDAPKPVYVSVLGKDSLHQISVYFPEKGTPETAVQVEAGRDVTLPNSIVFDEKGTREHLYVLVCERPVDLKVAKIVLQTGPSDGLSIEGCMVEEIEFIKISKDKGR